MPLKTTRREIAKVGKWGQDGTMVTESDLREVVETFVDESPISLGHTLADWMPKLGRVLNPEYDEQNKTLIADVIPNDLLAEAEQNGLYDTWSVGIKRRASDGKKYLHHLAFLGETPPKIKGLKILDTAVINAADMDETWTFKSSEFADKPQPSDLASLDVVDVSWDAGEARQKILDRYGMNGLKAYSLFRNQDMYIDDGYGYGFLVVDIVNDRPVIICRAFDGAMEYLEGTKGLNISEEVKNIVREKVDKALKTDSINAADNPTNLNKLLNSLIDDMADDDKPRADIISDIGKVAGIESGTVNQILNGSISCPPMERLKGFADVLGVKTDRLVRAAKRDGCKYDQEASDMGDTNVNDEVKERRLKLLEGQLLKSKKDALMEAMSGKVPKDKHGLVMNLADSLSLEETIELSDPDDSSKKVHRSSLDILIDIFKAVPLPVEPGERKFEEFADLNGKQISPGELVMKL